GGSYAPDPSGCLLSDIPFQWMIGEADRAGLAIEPHLPDSLKPDCLATLHQSAKHISRSKRPYYRPLRHVEAAVLIRHAVKARWETDSRYRPKNLVEYVEAHGWTALEN